MPSRMITAVATITYHLPCTAHLKSMAGRITSSAVLISTRIKLTLPAATSAALMRCLIADRIARLSSSDLSKPSQRQPPEFSKIF
jgi:hypothetical protein